MKGPIILIANLLTEGRGMAGFTAADAVRWVAQAIRGFDAVIIGPGSFYTSIMPPLLVRGVKEALADVRGPIILIANLLTEGRGMTGFTAADAARRVADAIERRVDVVIANTGRPSAEALTRYAAEHKKPLELGELDADVEPVLGRVWCTEIARHDRRRLAFAVWSVLSQRLLGVSEPARALAEVQKVP